MRDWRFGTPQHVDASARAARPLVERCLDEHRALMREAGVPEAGRPTGYLKVFRTRGRLESMWAEQSEHARKYGLAYQLLDGAGVNALEPHLAAGLAGGILATEPLSVIDPGALGKAYAGLLVKRGGRLATVDARTLEASGEGWLVRTVDGPLHAREVVVALGAWSSDIMAAQGCPVPMGVKRGYHMHYRANGNAVLNRPVIDAEFGYVLAPMARGIRLTTGAEFARRDAPPTPVQLGKVEPVARRLFPIGARMDEAAWMGCRPCLPDMLPMIGPVPGRKGLWADFGHHHLGFTLGPVSGRLLADMMTGETPFTDPFPYRVDRF
jgi:D-amino-acid dehydrogenase